MAGNFEIQGATLYRFGRCSDKALKSANGPSTSVVREYHEECSYREQCRLEANAALLFYAAGGRWRMPVGEVVSLQIHNPA